MKPAATLLRVATEHDLPVLFEHQRDPEAVRMADFPARERDAFMAHWAKILADPAVAKMTILHGGRVAGNIVSFDRSGLREVGYWLGREFWGRGIATEALRGFLILAPERPLHARVAAHNAGSIRVLEKCGFRIVDSDAVPPAGPGDDVEEVLLRLD